MLNFHKILGGRITGKEQYGKHDVCYVCISDMHLGEEDSLLTNIEGGNLESSKPSEVMVKLVDCLKEIIDENEGSKKPTLILNGDILELALTKTNIAAMTFDRFLELIIKEGEELFDRIIYLPGNHDHHIWELARENQYLKYINRHPS
ncbi:metallophosphoesterase [Methanosarcina sp. Mfa9]|uniref:metallophosphoesterase n=1 Tax=Methanosarcina sp. Mfa9 TaxID=3439063 RepID=UPI003F85E1AC